MCRLHWVLCVSEHARVHACMCVWRAVYSTHSAPLCYLYLYCVPLRIRSPMNTASIFEHTRYEPSNL